MTRLRTLLPFLLLPLGGCVVTSDEFAAIDSCLEAGQAWNYRSGRCERAAAGPVDFIRVDKSAHLMTVFRGGRVLREFRVALGSGGLAPKQRQGDQLVPEGRYRITARNSKSAYHLSLRIGYPTAEQLAAARSLGINPGGDIMIHGLPNHRSSIGSRHTTFDWTDGCIAVTNREIEWLYNAVADGTAVEIHA
jgi:murein L,D-transpeptidase YafK